MSDHQNFLKNMSGKSGHRTYLSAQGLSNAASGFDVRHSGSDPRIRPTSGDDLNSSIVNEWSSITRPRMDFNSNVLMNTVNRTGDKSEEERVIDDIAPNLALRVTATILAAVLRMNSDIVYLYELVQTYISFDNAYRGGE